MTSTLAPSMRETFLRTIDEELDTDPRLAAVFADISYAQLAGAARRHPDRVINLGIREQLLVSVAGGLALTGMRPVAHTFSPFLVERPLEQIKLDLTHQGVGAVLVSYGASYDMSRVGRTHHSPGDVAVLDSLPGWTVHVPGHADEARRLLLASLPGSDNVYIRLSGQSNARDFGTHGIRTLRTGSRGVVLAVGPVADNVLEATSGMDLTVLYTATVRPLDVAGLRAAVHAVDTPDVLLVEPYLAGTSAHVLSEALSDRPHRLRSLGVRRDSEVRLYGEPADHDAAHGLDAPGIAAAAKEFFG